MSLVSRGPRGCEELQVMSAEVSSPDRLHIHRLQVRYLVSSAHPFPERVKAKLDEVVTHGLGESLASRLAMMFPVADDAVWCIRRLELALDVNVAWDHEQLVRAWASQLTRTVAIAMQNGGDGENVLYFATRAAYLARFVSDLATGSAWGKWWYCSFAGLRLLPLSAAMRTALVDQSLVGEAALLLLAPDELKQVLCGLSVQDTRWVFNAIVAATADTDREEQHCFAAIWSTWQRGAGMVLTAEDEWRSALVLYLWTRREHPGGAVLRTAARTFVCFARCVSLFREQLVTALTVGDLVAVYTFCGAADGETLLPLLRCPPVWVEEVGRALLAGQTRPGYVTPSGAPERRPTPFGGLFLLFPLLDELPLRDATQGWPDVGEIPAATVVRLVVLLQCCGGTRAEAVCSDPLVRELLAIPPDFSVAMLPDWHVSITPAACVTFREVMASWQAEVLRLPDPPSHETLRQEDLTYLSLPERFGVQGEIEAMMREAAYTVMQAFARRLPGFAGSRLSYLYDNFLACTGSVEEEATRRVVRLGPAPLRLVLNLTGLTRKQYRLTWLDDRPFVLFPEE